MKAESAEYNTMHNVTLSHPHNNLPTQTLLDPKEITLHQQNIPLHQQSNITVEQITAVQMDPSAQFTTAGSETGVVAPILTQTLLQSPLQFHQVSSHHVIQTPQHVHQNQHNFPATLVNVQTEMEQSAHANIIAHLQPSTSTSPPVPLAREHEQSHTIPQSVHPSLPSGVDVSNIVAEPIAALAVETKIESDVKPPVRFIMCTVPIGSGFNGRGGD